MTRVERDRGNGNRNTPLHRVTDLAPRYVATCKEGFTAGACAHRFATDGWIVARSHQPHVGSHRLRGRFCLGCVARPWWVRQGTGHVGHSSEEHTSELQSLMRISYAVFCLEKK